ncbi:hypothetical protein EJ08DRAFT_664956 [Tothia fuscella]|uniref:Uncharacterized protein n=1 Tax=Tothia fuscella TaxID=1048955 RepID=A0A9P4NI67_9PEZI|nr:hypothetical protein EJ08DRAFT_664956 [Tothia fuscella]
MASNCLEPEFRFAPSRTNSSLFCSAKSCRDDFQKPGPFHLGLGIADETGHPQKMRQIVPQKPARARKAAAAEPAAAQSGSSTEPAPFITRRTSRQHSITAGPEPQAAAAAPVPPTTVDEHIECADETQLLDNEEMAKADLSNQFERTGGTFRRGRLLCCNISSSFAI